MSQNIPLSDEFYPQEVTEEEWAAFMSGPENVTVHVPTDDELSEMSHFYGEADPFTGQIGEAA